MCEKLPAKYPARFDIPADHFITRVIQAALRRLKSGGEVGVGALLLGGRYSVVFEVLSGILAEHDFKVRPRDNAGSAIVGAIIALGGLGRRDLGHQPQSGPVQIRTSGVMYPSRQHVKSKAGALKAARKEAL